MPQDPTELQNEGDRQFAQRMSVERTAPPTKVTGYEIQRFLGAGAYGEVWVGIDQTTGRKVAIKFFTGRHRVDVASLSREVEKLVYLSADRYVVQLLDVGWDSTPPYYVMDYIEQGSLDDFLSKQGSLNAHDALELFREIAIGLSHLHNRGVLHCDLKPANILLDEDRKPRLADFGQARLETEQNPALGTLFFMAPEQADLQAVPDTRWDVYGLGAIMYCMLVGSPPYRNKLALSEVESGDSLEDRLERYRRVINQAERPNEHRRIPDVDRGLAELIDRCLALNPRDRFESVQSVLVALEQLEESRSRQSLRMLGLVGPMALLLVMMLFSWGLYQNSVVRTDEALKLKSQESNTWAAQFAARSAAERINMFFDTVSRLSEDEKFLELFEQLVEDQKEFTEVTHILNQPSNNGSQAPKVLSARRTYVDLQQRQALQAWIDELLVRTDLPEVASWFVCDAQGLQVASVFAAEGAQSTVGKNYSYRTYFTGGPDDLITYRNRLATYDVPEVGRPRKHIEETHLSAAFASQATGTWKIAFSVPVYHSGEFLGILAATVDMGNFVEFSNETEHFVMLVDGRVGRNQGAILEHPLFDQLRSQGRLLPEELRQVRIASEVLNADRSEIKDPLALPEDQFEGTSAKQRTWLAARSPVQRRVDPTNRKTELNRVSTGLWVFALEDVDPILQPVHALSKEIARLGLLAMGFGLFIILGMWWMTIRSWNRARNRLNRVLVPSSGRRSITDISRRGPTLDAESTEQKTEPHAPPN